MFDASKGLFHFVFANQDDEYYIESLLRVQFLPYLHYQLFRDDFRYVYDFGRDPQNAKREFWMQCVGSLSIGAFEAGQKKKGLFSKNDKKEDGDIDGDIERSELNGEDLVQYFLQTLDVMRQNGQTAIVIPIQLFARFSYDDRVLTPLEELVRRSKNNAIVLTGSVRAEENNVFFVNPVAVYPNDTSKRPNDLIFYNPRIFPEIKAAYGTESGNLPKYVPVYKRLDAAFRGRTFFLNNLGFPILRAAVFYALLRQEPLRDPAAAPGIAAVILAWYKNQDFRAKYRDLNLEPNPFGLLRTVMKQLSPDTVGRLAEIAETERIDDPDVFFGRYAVETNLPLMVIADPANVPPVLRVLLRFRMLLGGHTNLLPKAEFHDLERITGIFSAPSYTSAYLHTPLPHERFGEQDVQLLLNEAFEALRDRQDWTTWDAAMMFILARLFWCCADEAEKPCVDDPYNQIAERRFDKAFEAMRYCRRMAKAEPDADTAALKFGNDVGSLLKNGTKDDLIKFYIPKTAD
ncbi:MAG: hypothetical protein IK104_04115 [Clostridia bacterium]|nr:hypothetical protein [Clostridia bacterium]